jgi:hypothetical protein
MRQHPLLRLRLLLDPLQPHHRQREQLSHQHHRLLLHLQLRHLQHLCGDGVLWPRLPIEQPSHQHRLRHQLHLLLRHHHQREQLNHQHHRLLLQLLMLHHHRLLLYDDVLPRQHLLRPISLIRFEPYEMLTQTYRCCLSDLQGSHQGYGEQLGETSELHDD